MPNQWFESVAVAQRRARKRLPKSVYGALSVTCKVRLLTFLTPERVLVVGAESPLGFIAS